MGDRELPLDEITERIIGAAIEVHRHLGPGLLESTYEACLVHELAARNLKFQRQKVLPLVYKGLCLDAGYRMDLLVEGRVVVEIKAIASIDPVHEAQLVSYLRLSRAPVGLLINFHVPQLVQGIRRKVNQFPTTISAPSAALR